jgi:hypothetical protein
MPAVPKIVMKSRRLISVSLAPYSHHRNGSKSEFERAEDVRFGSEADIGSAKGHVRFTPDSDRESGFSQKAMSALPPKADMCGANRNVRFVPMADIQGFGSDKRKKPGH